MKFKIFKEKIPSGETIEVSVLESWTVEWEYADWRGYYYDEKISYKNFINEKEAEKFKDELEKAAELIGTRVFIKLYKN